MTDQRRILPQRISSFLIAKLQVQPGDYLVLQTDLILDKEQVEYLTRRFNEQFKPLGIKVVILTAALKIGVVRKAKRRKAKP